MNVLQPKLRRLEGEAAMMKQPPFLVEIDPDVMKQIKIKVFDTLLQASEDGTAQFSLLNQLGACQKIMKEADIGKATPMDVLDERSTQAEDITLPLTLLQQMRSAGKPN